MTKDKDKKDKQPTKAAQALRQMMDEREAAGEGGRGAAAYLLDGLGYEPTTLWDHRSEEEVAEARAMATRYKGFLDRAKTEREYVSEAIAMLEEAGFIDLDRLETLEPGQRVYRSIRGKGLAVAVIGERPVSDGFNLVAAHIDSPRVDLKPRPLYEDSDLVLFKTHYYGGIKKYQWTSRPMALHGVVHRQDGTAVTICVGEDDDDPVFCFTDLLPHLAREQMKKGASEVVTGEQLNLLVGAQPYPEKGERRFSLGLLQLLNERYGIVERDLLSAELEIVPAGRARDVGFDRALIGAYGQDDRVCAWTAVEALMRMGDERGRTAVVLLTDKEEVGSAGNTGAQGRPYESFLQALFQGLSGAHDERAWRRAIEESAMLSADVVNGFDPTFPSVSDKLNNAFLGKGVTLLKATGSGGKGGASDASSEYMSLVTRLFDRHDVVWQTAELGRVDAGGGGTVAKFFANLGMEVIDCGVPLLSMHAPFEVSHILDVYETERAYRIFLEKR